MTMQDQQVQERFDQVIDQAQTAFWEAVATEYSEAQTGDLSPETVYFLEKAMREALAEWTENNLSPFENKTVEILLHTIEYWYKEADETVEIDDDNIEHIAYQISQGISEGELFTAVPYAKNRNRMQLGWWTIQK